MGSIEGGTTMQKHERAITITLIILFLLIMFLISNLIYRNNLIEEQQQKITDLEIELDSAKEIIDKQQLQIRDYEIIFNNLTIQDRLEVGK